ncbi:bis(5'-nucleosyl)-tetraphosphatase (symmetrical) [Sulfuriferula sp. AH1]|uniref:symmetrical bis(5'-nucleosyl)-tetraphosphatase n=1 Tax=Sulfuriferula sp. AH1 TaxID=1985873 RepID=UPI000B3B1DB6|nr:symmetrical bis(5'-nucleosyl)-tetraphosphatase [Sulfuriferula sp. AH1]ARU30471.1 bis(5'-nucleosyl)-tetraphosphatase (symmetrical) [Sulfuriferula sp. AH1]
MSTYAIGDLQGCFDALQKLLAHIAYDPAVDRIYLLGDLVNRGADSLAVLRWARTHDINAILGNHDLHLLAVSEGYATPHIGDTLQGILTAPDREELLSWLRHLPLATSAAGYLLVHAGLLPQWSPAKALALAAEVEAVLRGPDYRDFLREMYGNKPASWHDDLQGVERLRVVTNAMTRLRFCTPEGEMEFKAKGDPAHPPAGCLPWFHVPNRQSAGSPIVFGHWSALGLHVESDSIALDTGCLWGGQLTALRLEDRQVIQVECAGLAGTMHWQ